MADDPNRLPQAAGRRERSDREPGIPASSGAGPERPGAKHQERADMSGAPAPDTPPGPMVWIGDRLVAVADARVSPFDHGILVGDGVFETMRVYGGVPFAWRRHLARLEHSA